MNQKYSFDLLVGQLVKLVDLCMRRVSLNKVGRGGVRESGDY